MAEPQLEAIGRVEGFFAKPSVARITLTAPLRVGDRVYIKGYTTDMQHVVASLQVNHQSVECAEPGQSVGLRTTDRCRKHDIVYRLLS